MKLFGTARGLVAQAKETVAEYDATSPHTAGQVRQAIGGLLITDGLVGLENPFGAKTRAGIFGHLVQILFAVVWLGLSIGMMNLFSPDGDATTTGTVTQVNDPQGNDSTTCSVVAEFWVDGRPYRAASDYSSSSLCGKNVGSTVEIRYDSANPANAGVDDGMDWFPWIFIGAGTLVLVPGLVGFAFSLAAILFGWKLVRAGRAMSAANPATSTDQGIVAEARDEFLRAMAVLRGPGKVLGGSSAHPARTPSLAHLFAQPTAQPPNQPPAQQLTQPPTVGPDGRPVAPPAIVPGWYRTADGASERWHDGVQWTVHVRPYHPAPPRLPGS